MHQPPAGLDPEQMQEHWCQALRGPVGGLSSELEHSGALALALAPYVSHPFVEFSEHGIFPEGSALHAALFPLVRQARESRQPSAAPRVAVDLASGEPWPEGFFQLPARERLACWLVRAGADPWAKDGDGKDALDLAFQANARSLVRALLAHPGAPARAQLQARLATDASGRALPWLHAAALAGHALLFTDLVEWGLDPASPDRQGVPPAGWAKDPATLESILHLGAPVTPQQASVVAQSWARRNAREKYVPLDVAACQALLDLHAPLDSAQATERAVRQEMEAQLAANPAQPHRYRGRKWIGASGLPPAADPAFLEWLESHASIRHTVARGAARGRWSPLAAALWSAHRLSADSPSVAQVAQRTVLDALARMPAAQRHGLMEEQIRPGLPARGLLAWGCAAQATDWEREMIAGSPDPAVFRQLALAAARELCTPRPADKWATVIARGVAQAFVPAPDDIGNPDSAWWSQAAQLASPDAPLILFGLAMQIMTALEASFASLGAGQHPGPAHRAQVHLALGLLGKNCWELAARPVDFPAPAPASWSKTQHQVWQALAAVIQRHPGLAPWPHPYPFERDTLAKMDGVPSPAQWEARGLEHRLDDRLVVPSSAARPRM